MQVSVNKPNFKDDLLKKVAIARGKGASYLIESAEGYVLISVYAGTRPIGRFMFANFEDIVILKKRHIIEREFYPFEFMLFNLVKYLKRKKVKFIEY